MKKASSFFVDHLKLLPGLYVSRKDYLKEDVLTTFDIRLTAPNRESVLDTDGIHAIEHLGATFLRSNEEWSDRIIYFGPMGCRTGFYLILNGDLTSSSALPLVKSVFAFIANFEGEIPGSKPNECGNYTDMSLSKAKEYAYHYYYNILMNIDKSRLNY